MWDWRTLLATGPCRRPPTVTSWARPTQRGADDGGDVRGNRTLLGGLERPAADPAARTPEVCPTRFELVHQGSEPRVASSRGRVSSPRPESNWLTQFRKPQLGST